MIEPKFKAMKKPCPICGDVMANPVADHCHETRRRSARHRQDHAAQSPAPAGGDGVTPPVIAARDPNWDPAPVAGCVTGDLFWVGGSPFSGHLADLMLSAIRGFAQGKCESSWGEISGDGCK